MDAWVDSQTEKGWSETSRIPLLVWRDAFDSCQRGVMHHNDNDRRAGRVRLTNVGADLSLKLGSLCNLQDAILQPVAGMVS